MPLSRATDVAATGSTFGSMPAPTTAKSHSMRTPVLVRTRFSLSSPSNATTASWGINSTPCSRWIPAITAPASAPSTVSSGDLPLRTAVTDTFSAFSDAATSEPMNPMPTTTALVRGFATCLIASQSATVRSTWTPGRWIPGSAGVRGRPPVHNTTWS